MCCRCVFRISQWIHNHQKTVVSLLKRICWKVSQGGCTVSVPFSSTLSAAPTPLLNPEGPSLLLTEDTLCFPLKRKNVWCPTNSPDLSAMGLTSMGPILPTLDPRGSEKVLHAPQWALFAGVAFPCFGSGKSVTLCLCVPAFRVVLPLSCLVLCFQDKHDSPVI